MYNVLTIDAREVNKNVVCKTVFLDSITVQFLGSQHLPNLSRVVSSFQLIKQIFFVPLAKKGEFGFRRKRMLSRIDPNKSKGIHIRPNESRAEF